MVTRASILLIILFILVGISYTNTSGPRMKRKPLQEKLTSAANFGEGSAQVRLQLWKKTLSMIADHPVLGVGAGNWKVVIPHYGTNGLPSEQGKVQYIRPHNDFLWILSENGPIALLAYLSLFAISTCYSFMALKRTKGWEERFFLIMIL